LKNTTAGIHSAREGIPKTSKLNFNLEILKLNYDDYIVQTVGHEVAHHICFVKYGVERTTPRFKSTGRIISHGKRWKFTMMALGLNVKRCHNYQLPECFTKKLFIYECGCMKHSLTKTRHNKVLKGSASYGCTICGKTLKHVK
jgi:SprT protein